MSDTERAGTLFDEAADAVVDLGNRLMEDHPEADPWEIGSALLTGAVHFWLYTRRPCGDPACEDCAGVRGGKYGSQGVFAKQRTVRRASYREMVRCWRERTLP